jgi:iron complex outermembrane receptor protein
LSTSSGVAASGILNGGKSRIYGAEVDSTLVPMRSLTLGFNYAFLATKLLSLTIPTVPGYLVLPNAEAGTPLPFSPKNKASAYATYNLPVADTLGGISIGAVYSYTSKTFIAAITPYGTLPSYGLVNMNLNWHSILGHPIDAELFVTNLAGKLYYNNVTQFYNNFGFEDHYPGEPRTYGGRIRIRFGKADWAN